MLTALVEVYGVFLGAPMPDGKRRRARLLALALVIVLGILFVAMSNSVEKFPSDQTVIKNPPSQG